MPLPLYLTLFFSPTPLLVSFLFVHFIFLCLTGVAPLSINGGYSVKHGQLTDGMLLSEIAFPNPTII